MFLLCLYIYIDFKLQKQQNKKNKKNMKCFVMKKITISSTSENSNLFFKINCMKKKRKLCP